jgi:PAS domain S-box-containing protein
VGLRPEFASSSGEPRFEVREADYRLLVESVVDGAIFMLDPTGRIATWNHGAERIFGFRRDEIIGLHISTFYPVDGARSGQADDALEVARRIGRFEEEAARVRKDGAHFLAGVVTVPLWTESGVLRGYGKVIRDLSEQRRAEDELRQSEERLRLLIDSASDYAIFLLDPRGNVVTWNAGAARLKGYAPHEIIGRHFSVFYAEPARLAHRPQEMLDIAAEKGRAEDEGWRVRKDGTHFWANVILTAVRDHRGNLLGFTKVTRDMTERRRTEEMTQKLAREEAARAAAEEAKVRIRDSEERFRDLSVRLDAILRNVSEGITVHDKTGRIVYANDEAARVCRYSSAEALIAAAPTEIFARFETLGEDGCPIPPDRFPARRLLIGETPDPLLMHVRDRIVGDEWWTLIKATAVTNPSGGVELVITIFHDVTAARKQQEADRFFSEASAVLGQSLHIEETLQSFADLLVPDLGDWCTLEVFEGGALKSLAIAHHDPALLESAREVRKNYPPRLDAKLGTANVLRTGKSELYPEITDAMLVAGAEDERHVELLRRFRLQSAMAVPLSAHGRALGVMTLLSSNSRRRYDETDLLLAEELGRRAGLAIENARLYQQAKRAIEVREEFLSVASHELRTPLTTLELHMSALTVAAHRGKLKELPSDKLELRITRAHQQVGRLAELITDLLDVSLIAQGRLLLRRQRFDLVALAREVADRFEHEAERAGTCLVVRGGPELIGVWDRNRIDQIVTNLITNAIKYGPGRPIELTVDARAKDAHPKAWARISVRDEGVGIASEDQTRIFDRFERAAASRSVGGLGLGLWIVRQTSEAHGGSVRVESEIGKGSTFIVELPIESTQGDALEQAGDGGRR